MEYAFNRVFRALLSEAQFTKEMLGAGATQIRKANYATKGVYFQAFTSLSTGIERIGKLCLMLDYYIEKDGEFPDLAYMKREICHNLLLIYKKSSELAARRTVSFEFLNNLNGKIHQNILTVLSSFAEGDRYSNINLLVGRKTGDDPVKAWYEKVDQQIFELYVIPSRKATISHNARLIDELIGNFTHAHYIGEAEGEITSVQDASYRTGFFEAVAPLRQLFVLQIIRFWVELLWQLQHKAMAIGKEDVPFFSEMFAPFYNSDCYIKTRRTWDKV